MDNFCKEKGLKSIVYGYKDLDADDWDFQKDQNNNFANEADRLLLERDFVFLGAFGLNDDLREGIKETIEKLKSENINIRMISGDNYFTAVHCAKLAGII